MSTTYFKLLIRNFYKKFLAISVKIWYNRLNISQGEKTIRKWKLMSLKKREKSPKSNLFLLGQILLGALIIAVIIISGNLIYHGDLESTKQMRLNTEIENMKETISNNISTTRKSCAIISEKSSPRATFCFRLSTTFLKWQKLRAEKPSSMKQPST